MNYISVIVVGYTLLAMVWWFIRARKVFRGPQGGDDVCSDEYYSNGRSVQNGTGHPI